MEPAKFTPKYPQFAPETADCEVEEYLEFRGTVHAKKTKSGILNPAAARKILDLDHSLTKEPMMLTQHHPKISPGIADLGADEDVDTVHAKNINPGNLKKSADLLQLGVSKLNPDPKESTRRNGGNNGGTFQRLRNQSKIRGRSRPVQSWVSRNPEANTGGVWMTPDRSYASLMNSNPLEKKLKLMYVEPQKEADGSCFFEPNGDDLQEAVSKWKNYVVGYFVADKLQYAVVERIAKAFWAKFGLSEVLADSGGFFYFCIPDATRRRNILEGGPWMFQGRPIILQQWTPDLVLCKQSHDKIPFWVRIHRIPLALWTAKGLSGVASLIGRPLYADSYTEEMRRISFARVCIEVNALQPLPEAVEVKLGGTALCLKVDYQWKPTRCEKCCVFGHQCKDKLDGENVRQKANAGQEIQKAQTDAEGFTLVRRRKAVNARNIADSCQATEIPLPVMNNSLDEEGIDEAYDAITNNTFPKDTNALLDDGKSEVSSSSEEEIEAELQPGSTTAVVEAPVKNPRLVVPEVAAQDNHVVALPAAPFPNGHQQHSKGSKDADKKKGRTSISQLQLHSDTQTASSDEEDTEALETLYSSQYDVSTSEVPTKGERRETRQHQKKNQKNKQEAQPQSAQVGGSNAPKPKKR